MITLTDEDYAEIKDMADYQVPHKPEWHSGSYVVLGSYCPKCGEEIDESYTFCPKCGQRIDWSDGKEE